jgi:hypothetical protein
MSASAAEYNATVIDEFHATANQSSASPGYRPARPLSDYE